MRLSTLTIVGTGLIGGSIGLAARRRGVAARVIGVGRQLSSLDRAVAVGAIDTGTLDLDDAVADAELVVFCTPVGQLAEQIIRGASRCRPGTLLTDAGSTKAVIVRRVEAAGPLPNGVVFVGSHPLAGSEKRGPDFADANLFQNRVTVVTPSASTAAADVERTAAFWRALGSRVRLMNPDDHDRALALTSHLPHALASALAGILPLELAELTATGFRDTTRIAAGDPNLWTAIFLHNRAAVLDAMTTFGTQLDRFRAALEANDAAALDCFLSHAKKVRDALGS